MRIAIAQLCSSNDPWENLLLAKAFVDEAETQGADLVCFPECIFYRGPRQPKDFLRQEIFLDPNRRRALSEGNDFNRAFYEIFADCRAAISFGSVMEKAPQEDLPFNSHWFLKPGGEDPTSYKKIHLFHFDAPGARYRESEDFSGGAEPVVVEWKGWRLGLSICYDVRFPELFRQLVIRKQAEILLIPAAFTAVTGEVHWELLLRARAVENLSYVVASGQWGLHHNSRGEALSCYGNSLFVSPWGQVLARAKFGGDALLLCEVSRDHLQDVRAKLPALSNCKLL
jgi:predicted amidohydrolase